VGPISSNAARRLLGRQAEQLATLSLSLRASHPPEAARRWALGECL